MGIDFDYSKLDAMDILDLAVFVEREAESGYEELASWAETENPEAAAFFRRMAGFEVRHGAQVAARRQELFGDAPAKVSDSAPWEVETPDYDKLGPTFTLRQAYEVGLEAEGRAAAYYRNVIDYVSDPLILELLEFLRDSELEHERMIKEEMAKL